MKVCVLGLWHLGCVIAACLADKGFDVIGLDEDTSVVERLRAGKAPIFEPGLDALVAQGLGRGRLSFTTDAAAAAAADVLWVAYDTPVDDDDRADVEFVKSRVRRLLPHLRRGSVVLISSQMPVGSVAELEREDAARGARLSFACSPENLRLGAAIEAFRSPGRIVIGARDARARQAIEPLLAPFSEKLLWVSVESAEMSKHALNAFLAVSVTFINEIATLCEKAGADVYEVEAALRSEPRVGAKAYVRPGAAFAGGTLARDVMYLNHIGKRAKASTPLLGGVLPSNRAHRAWPLERTLEALAPAMPGATAAVLGLAYKPGTDALRRSVAIELIRGLLERGAKVRAFDPVVRALPPELAAVQLAPTAEDAAAGADALVVATDWPEFGKLAVDSIVGRMARAIVIDQNRTLPAAFAADPRIRYLTIGRKT